MKLFITIVTAFLLFSCLEDNAVKPSKTDPRARVANYTCSDKSYAWRIGPTYGTLTGPYNTRIALIHTDNINFSTDGSGYLASTIRIKNLSSQPLDFTYQNVTYSLGGLNTTVTLPQIQVYGCFYSDPQVQINFAQSRGYHGTHNLLIEWYGLNAPHTVQAGYNPWLNITLSQ